MKSLQGQLLVASPHFVGSPVPRAVVLVTEHDEQRAAGVVLNHPANEQILRMCLEMWQEGKTPAAALQMIQPQVPGLESLISAVQQDGDHASSDEHPKLPDPAKHCKKESHCTRKESNDPEKSTNSEVKEIDGALPADQAGKPAEEISAELNEQNEQVERAESAEQSEQTEQPAGGELTTSPPEIEVPIGLLMAPPEMGGGRLGKHLPPLFRVVIGQVGWDSEALVQELRLGHWLTTPATPDLIFLPHDDLWQYAVRQVGHNVLQSSLGLASDVPAGLN